MTLDDMKNRIICGDALELLSNIPEGSIDLVICDGPYGVTEKSWDKVGSIQDYNLELIHIFSRVLKQGGAAYLFGKHNCLDFIDYRPFLDLVNRIVWYQPARLGQGRKRYTNNHDIIAYFVKHGAEPTFDLDAIRVPQLVELEHRMRCERVPSVRNGRYGKTHFNEKGKNPGDVWGDIKQLTYKSKELASPELHTIQKPEKLVERIVKASSNRGDTILDPFMGTGTTAVVARRLGRDFVGFEINPTYVEIAESRLSRLEEEEEAAAAQVSLFE